MSPTEQFQHNAKMWLAAQSATTSLIIREGILGPKEDKCYFLFTDALITWIRANMNPWGYMINSKDHQPLGYPTAKGGWRERRARYAAQVILHEDIRSVVPVELFLEIDFDANNPNWGLAPAIAHAIWDFAYQKLTHRKTSPYAVAKARGWLV